MARKKQKKKRGCIVRLSVVHELKENAKKERKNVEKRRKERGSKERKRKRKIFR